jgi:type III secretory pathway component EscS
MWLFLTILSVVLLVIYFHSRNAVWGGLIIGVIIGLIIAFIGSFRGNGFNWLIVKRIAIIATLLGFGSELLGMISDKLKHK